MSTARNIHTPQDWPPDTPIQFIRDLEELFQAANGGIEGGDAITRTQQSAITALTDSTGGTADGTLSACGNTSTSDQSAVINNNFAELNDKLDAILTALAGFGLTE